MTEPGIEVAGVDAGLTTELTAELIVDGTEAAAPVVSLDGRLVAWTASRVVGRGQQPVSELWLAPVDHSAPPIRLADDGGPARLPRWSADSAWLFCVAGEEVRRLPAGAGGLAAATGGAEPVLRWRGEISGLVPLAGGRLVAVVAADELTADDERLQADGDDVLVWSERAVRQHWLWHRLRLLDLATGDLTIVAGLAGRHVLEVAQRPDGGPLAVVSRECPEEEPGAFTGRVHVVDVGAGEPGSGGVGSGVARDLGPVRLETRGLSWWRAADGWHLAWVTAVPPADAWAVHDVRVADGAVQADGVSGDTVTGDVVTGHKPDDLTSGMDVCPLELAQAGGGPVVGLFASGLDSAVYRLDPAARSFEPLATLPGAASDLSASADGSVIALTRSTACTPPDVYAGPPGGLARISDTRPELRGVAWGTQERLTWRAPDGLEIEGVLVLPPGRSRADGPFPLVTIVHGGPYWRWADQLMATWWSWGQYLAAAGYAVLHPNPRGGQGRGRAFADPVAGNIGRDEFTDILAGIDHLVAAGVADPGRLGISGHSHGGFIAAWAVTQTDRFRAAVMAAGPVDWGMEVAAGENGRGEAIWGGSFGWEGPGPHPHDQVSPVSYAANVRTPVLILQGEDDANVPVGQAMYFHRALTHYGVDHELAIYPREGHSYNERAHQLDVTTRVRAWFDRYLGA